MIRPQLGDLSNMQEHCEGQEEFYSARSMEASLIPCLFANRKYQLAKYFLRVNAENMTADVVYPDNLNRVRLSIDLSRTHARQISKRIRDEEYETKPGTINKNL